MTKKKGLKLVDEVTDETVIDAEVEEVDTTPEQFKATLEATANFFAATGDLFNAKVQRAFHALETWKAVDHESDLGLAAKMVLDTVFADLVKTSDDLQSLAEKPAEESTWLERLEIEYNETLTRMFKLGDAIDSGTVPVVEIPVLIEQYNAMVGYVNVMKGRLGLTVKLDTIPEDVTVEGEDV